MISNKRVKSYILIFLVFIFVVSICVGLYYDSNCCMGILCISEKQLSSCTEDMQIDISDITYNGECVAVDTDTRSIYISQSQDSLEHSSTLLGNLESENSNHNLFFLRDENLSNIKETVVNGRPLTLIVREKDSFCRVNVIISTLPIVSINGDFYGEVSSKGLPVYSGEMTLFAGLNPGTGNADIENCSVEWHLRGATTSKLEKKPWKLSLKDKKGENLDADFLGMGEDDDWILNPMNMDDTKLREKTAMDLWNRCVKHPQDDYMMSSAQYVEVVMNGDYQGLYLLQRRIDAKYLEIDKKNDLMFKGFPTWSPASIYEGYEIVYSPFDYAESYERLEEVLSNQNGNVFSIDNYVNVNLLLQFLTAYDNVGYKNMFYVLQKSEAGYEMYLVPWDTDLSMGIIYDAGFVYDYETSMQAFPIRIDYEKMKELYPDLDTRIAQRWYELRDSVFAPGTQLEHILEENKQCILESGAFERDNQRWGFYYGGEDTIEKLFQWCEERVEKMDEYY